MALAIPETTSRAVSDANDPAKTAMASIETALAIDDARIERTDPSRSTVCPKSTEQRAAARNDNPIANPSPVSPKPRSLRMRTPRAPVRNPGRTPVVATRTVAASGRRSDVRSGGTAGGR